MNNHRQHIGLQSGMSIIELMIAMTIGLLIMAGLANLFVQSKQSFRQDNLISRMQEDARFAMNLLSTDVSMAGFFGPIQESISIENTASIPGANPAFTYGLPMVSADAIAAGDGLDWSAALDDVKPGTDAISIRRVEGSTTAEADLETGFYYLETNGQEANMILGDDGPTGDFTNPDFWEYSPSIYYIRTWCRTGDGVPSLVKRYWDGTGVVTDCIASGIEDMQVELGLDANEDLVPEIYSSSDITTSAETGQLASVRIHILARSVDPDRQYTNTKTYNLGNAAAYTPNDSFYRRVYTTTVQTRNPTGYRALTYAGSISNSAAN